MWSQVYNPLGSAVLSTLAAAIPVVVLLGLIATDVVKAHVAALLALAVAILVAVFVFTMPMGLALRAALFGAVTGLFPIGWIILNVIFLYRLTVEKGWFETLQQSIGGITADRRLQLLLIAFAFGAFFEGASGFGTPVAVTGALLMGLGFSPLAASGLSLIANTAPVAYGALGTPIQGLATVTGFDPYVLGAMVGRQLPFFSFIVPFWLIWVFAGFRGMMQIWPAIFVCGLSFAVSQFLFSNYVNPWIVDIGASIVSHGLPCRVPEGLAAGGDLDFPRPADARHLGGHHAAARRAQSPSVAGGNHLVVDALAHPVHRRRDLGNGLVQVAREPDLHLELSDRGPGPHGPEGAARRRKAGGGARDLRLHVPVLHGHWHPDRRDHFGAR